MNPNVRKIVETQSEYKARRKAEIKAERAQANGWLFWDSNKN